MTTENTIEKQGQTEQVEESLKRLLPRIEARFDGQTEAAEWDAYIERFKLHFPRLFACLYSLFSASCSVAKDP